MKKRTINSSIEFYSQVRSELAIRRCDVALFLFDATLEISQVDKKLAMQVVESGRPCVLVVNKWDLATEGVRTGNYLEYLADRLPGLHFAPVVFSSARDGMNLKGIIDVAFDLHEQAQIRVGTGELNRVLEAAFTRKKPGGKDGFKARVFYGTQIDRSPPTFLVFVNDANLFSADYRRYLQNCLREAFAFTEVPVHVLLRQRSSLPRG